MFYVEAKQSWSSVLARQRNENFNSLKDPEECKKVVTCNSIYILKKNIYIPRKIVPYSFKKWR